MMNEVDGEGLCLKKSRLALVILFSMLLLTGILLGVFQTSGADAGSWVGEGNVVDEADVSFGRSPDGEGLWHTMSEVVTPAEPNQLVGIPDGLVINEFMADNDITIAGPDGTYPDWIELYNGGNVSVNVGGMYLTDNLKTPTKWQFPDDTVIEAGGYLLIWADNSSDQQSLHTSYGLNANGEEIGLFACDGETLIDSIVYTKQLGDVSYGRMPDGSSNWEHLLSATPGWGNTERQYEAGSSFWPVLLLLGLVGVICILFVAGCKLNAKRR